MGEMGSAENTLIEKCVSYRKALYGFVLGMARDAALTEDIVQETYARAIRGISGFSGKSELKTWLFAIAKNEAFRAIGKGKNDLRKLEALRKRENANRAEVDMGEFDRESTIRQIKDGCLYALLHCLPFSQRCAFILNALNGMPMKEVAAIIGKSENATRIDSTRAKATVRRFLCSHCEYLSARPKCRCANMLDYSMKHSLIKKIGSSSSRIEEAKAELRRFKNEVELLKSLTEGESPYRIIFSKE
jgi:RNA polymerase sigma factor (sigma-70 family)